jgi:5S rRNA maturation endonuclease (ribonuclease M5)
MSARIFKFADLIKATHEPKRIGIITNFDDHGNIWVKWFCKEREIPYHPFTSQYWIKVST